MPVARTDPSRFVICIGSQRAGTTLLHRVLGESTPVFMHPLKEVHYFDTVLGVRPFDTLHTYCEHVRPTGPRARLRRTMRLLRSRGGRTRTTDLADATLEHALDRLLACESPEDVAQIGYVELFRPAAHRSAVLGEATPEYMLLPPEGIRRMRHDVGADARIILLRRDPVQRFLSSYALRHAYLRTEDYDPGALDQQVMLEQVRTRVPWLDEQVAYSDYDWALAQYRAVFDHVLDLQLADLGSGDPAVADRLSAFLGVPVDPGVFRTFVGARDNALGAFVVSEETRAELADLLAGYMAERRQSSAPST